MVFRNHSGRRLEINLAYSASNYHKRDLARGRIISMDNTDKTVRGSFTVRTGRKSLVLFTFAAVAVFATAVFLIWPDVNEQGTVSASQRVDNVRLQDMYGQVVRLGNTRGYAVY